MKVHATQTVSAFLLVSVSLCCDRTDAKPKNASLAVLQAFDTHDIVMLGEIHWNKQEYEWLRSRSLTQNSPIGLTTL